MAINYNHKEFEDSEVGKKIDMQKWNFETSIIGPTEKSWALYLLGF